MSTEKAMAKSKSHGGVTQTRAGPSPPRRAMRRFSAFGPPKVTMLAMKAATKLMTQLTMPPIRPMQPASARKRARMSRT